MAARALEWAISECDRHMRPAEEPATGLSVRVRVIDAARRAEARALWEDLEHRVGGRRVASSWLWTSAYLEHYGDVVAHRFFVAERAGVPVGMVLVTDGVGRRHGPIAVSTRHLGTAGEAAHELVFVEYNRLLAAEADRAAFAGAVVDRLLREPWDELHLDGFVPEDAAALVRGRPAFVVRREPCPTMDLTAALAAGGILEALAPGPRQRVRRSLRKLGPVTGEWARTPAAALDILDELMCLHERRWARENGRGAFAGRRMVAFHRDVAVRLLARDQAVLFRVRAGGSTLGCVYGFVEDGRLLFYQSGLATAADNRVKPGLTVHVLCMQAALERGLAEYDFLAGDQRYKRELSNTVRELVWASLVRRRPRPLLIAAGRRARALLLRARR